MGETAERSITQECRELRDLALEKMGRPAILERGAAKSERGEILLERSIGSCQQAADSAREPALAAEMKALEYLGRARLAPTHPRPGERGRGEVLLEGVEAIRALHQESPAWIVLARKAGTTLYNENPEYGRRLVERAIEGAREAYGENDPRYADELFWLGFLHAPIQPLGSSPRPHADAERAERYLKETLAIYLRQEDPSRHEGLASTLDALRRLYEATGRGEDAGDFRDMLTEIYEAEAREREAKTLEDEPEPPAEGEAGTSTGRE